MTRWYPYNNADQVAQLSEVEKSKSYLIAINGIFERKTLKILPLVVVKYRASSTYFSTADSCDQVGVVAWLGFLMSFLRKQESREYLSELYSKFLYNFAYFKFFSGFLLSQE